MSDIAKGSAVACQLTIEIREPGVAPGPDLGKSLTSSRTGASLRISMHGTQITLQLQPISVEPARSQAVPTPATDSPEPSDVPMAPETLPEFGTPEYEAAYRQQWADAGRKAGPNILAWGCDETA